MDASASAESPSVQVFLPKGTLVQSRGGFGIRVVQGRLWITRSGDPTDFFATPSQSYAAPRNTQLLIEAESDTWIALSAGNCANRRFPVGLSITPHVWKLA